MPLQSAWAPGGTRGWEAGVGEACVGTGGEPGPQARRQAGLIRAGQGSVAGGGPWGCPRWLGGPELGGSRSQGALVAMQVGAPREGPRGLRRSMPRPAQAGRTQRPVREGGVLLEPPWSGQEQPPSAARDPVSRPQSPQALGPRCRAAAPLRRDLRGCKPRVPQTFRGA